MWQSVEIASHIHKLKERLESCSFAKQNTYCINQFIYYKKWVNLPLNLILSESSQFFCANRPVRFFARIVPVESSQGGTGFCAKRPVTVLHGAILHGAIQVAGNKSVIFSFEIRRRLLRIYMNASASTKR